MALDVGYWQIVLQKSAYWIGGAIFVPLRAAC